MKNNKEILDDVKNVCKKVLAGSMNLRNLYDAWPEQANINPLLKQIFQDLEDAIEHTPGFIMKKGIDLKAWHSSDMYLTIFLDSVLLEYNENPEALLQYRKKILNKKDLSKETILNAIKKKATGG